MIVPGLNVLPYRLRRGLARQRIQTHHCRGWTRQAIIVAKCLLAKRMGPELGFTRVRISLLRKSDKSDLRGQAP